MCLVWAIIFRCLVWNRGMSVRDCLVRWGSQVRKNSLEIKCLRLWILTVTGQDLGIMAFNHQQAIGAFHINSQWFGPGFSRRRCNEGRPTAAIELGL